MTGATSAAAPAAAGAAARAAASAGGGSSSGGGGRGRRRRRHTRSSRPTHDKCGTRLGRMYYTTYDRARGGSKTWPLHDWMWCIECRIPVAMIQRDAADTKRGAAEAGMDGGTENGPNGVAAQ